MVVEVLGVACFSTKEQNKTHFHGSSHIPLPGESSTCNKCNAFMIYLLSAFSFRATNVLMRKISRSSALNVCSSNFLDLMN